MDLWIKSTDGSLIKVENLRIKQHKYLDPTRIIWAIITEKRDFLSGNYLFLGKYKTRERALEVLEEIQQLLFPFKDSQKLKFIQTSDPQNLIEHCKNLQDGTIYICGETPEIDFKQLNCIVYEMPKE